MAITAIKTIKFEEVMKLFTKYNRKSPRPVLNYVQYSNGYFTATNSHVLLRVNAKYVSDIPANMEEGRLFDPKEMLFANVQMNYPETSRLIPNHFNSTVLLNGHIKEIQQHIKEIKKVVKKNKNKVMKLEFTSKGTGLHSHNSDNEGYSTFMESMYIEGEEVTLHVNADYINDALGVIKKLSKLSYNDIELGIVSPMRPITFKQDGVFDIIILPVRIS
jgi:DNA polymerase III sliding clamp (beta) subunit (PCNA family)